MTGTTGSMMRPIFILLLVQAAAENKLTCDSQDATVGEDVTLSCHFEKHRDVTDKSIAWRFNRNINVLVYRNKGFSADQAEQFRGRASQGSSWNPAEGKVPVEISSFKETDAGEYTCTVGTVRSQKVSCSTTLNVLQVHEQVNSPPADQLNLNRAPCSDEQGRNRIGTINVIVIAIVIGVFMIWRSKNKDKPRKTKEKKRLLGLDSAADVTQKRRWLS